MMFLKVIFGMLYRPEECTFVEFRTEFLALPTGAVGEPSLKNFLLFFCYLWVCFEVFDDAPIDRLELGLLNLFF
jgi:hypothetical protein